MRRGLVSACLAIGVIGLTATSSPAQQESTASSVQIHEATETPGWWVMDIPSAAAAWYIQLGEGCENAQAGDAVLLIDGLRVEWLVLPDATPGTCQIQQATQADHY